MKNKRGNLFFSLIAIFSLSSWTCGQQSVQNPIFGQSTKKKKTDVSYYTRT